METVRVATWINAPVERCFLLSTHLDLRYASGVPAQERPLAGATAGMMREGDIVPFQGRHFGLPGVRSTRVEILRPHAFFQEVMVAGSLRHFEHDHHFATMDDGARVRDEIRFSLSPGVVGRIARGFVRRHLVAMLQERHAMLRRVAESEQWRQYVDRAASVASPRAVEDRASDRWDKGVVLRGSPSTSPGLRI